MAERPWPPANTMPLRDDAAPIRSPAFAKQDEKPAKGLAVQRTQSMLSRGTQKEEFLKFKERSGNVYENKGPLRKTPSESRNVVENTGTYWHYTLI